VEEVLFVESLSSERFLCIWRLGFPDPGHINHINTWEMSSLRNAVKRKTHKERAQLAHRRRLGPLEKKKDYKVRATHFHKNEKKLRALRRRADFRNPDEFYFKMVSTRTKDGVHMTEREKPDEDITKLIRTQNIAYLRLHDEIEESKIRKLKERLHFLNDPLQGDVPAPENVHLVFLSDDEEEEDVEESATAASSVAVLPFEQAKRLDTSVVQKFAKKAESFNKAEYFETTETFVDRTFHRPTKEALKNGDLFVSGNPASLKLAMKEREAMYTELNDRIRRQEKIRRAMRHMETRKKLAGKGRRWKIQEGTKKNPPVFMWKQERKR